MTVALAVGFGGALGAVVRYLVDGAVQDRTSGSWPVGTLVINVAGSLVLGVIVGLVIHHDVSPEIRSILGTGFCGGLTTWSTATWEVNELASQGSRRTAALYAVVSLVASTTTAALGLAATALV